MKPEANHMHYSVDVMCIIYLDISTKLFLIPHKTMTQEDTVLIFSYDPVSWLIGDFVITYDWC